MKMKAAVVRQATDPYKFEEVELAEPKNDEVLVRITASGLCHTCLLYTSDAADEL